MKFMRSRRFLVLVVSLLLVASLVVGCSAIQKAAQDVQYVTSPNGAGATTQPSAALEAARTVVQVASAANPAIAEIASLVALLSGAIAGIAGHFTGKRIARKQADTVIAEIIADIAAFKEPGVPWTDKTRKLLEDLGYGEDSQPAGSQDA